MLDDLKKLLGSEQTPDDVIFALRRCVRSLDAPAIGALQVTCSDETEWSIIDPFQRLPSGADGQHQPIVLNKDFKFFLQGQEKCHSMAG